MEKQKNMVILMMLSKDLKVFIKKGKSGMENPTGNLKEEKFEEVILIFILVI